MFRRALVALALVACLTPAADACFWLRRQPVPVTSGYYFPAPVFWVPAPAPAIFTTPLMTPAPPMPPATILSPTPAPPVIAAPIAPPTAPPLAAPPSMEPIDPRRESSTSQRPVTSSARQVSGQYFSFYPGSARPGSTTSRDRCSVAFWNLTSSAFTIEVAGERRIILPGQSATLELPRSFTWRIVGRDFETTRLADGDTAGEILVRR
jgi:hypothetical protein